MKVRPTDAEDAPHCDGEGELIYEPRLPDLQHGDLQCLA